MDIKSIIRVFRFNEMQSRADRDPDARRPPTVKFLGVALLLGLLLVLISFWSAPQADVNSAVPLQITTTSPALDANATTQPSPGGQDAPTADDAPTSEAQVARAQDGP